ncbi:hypothetical protein [Wielerella bovis]|nr:hypothetical protein [Wielerella bovis]MCG7656929.1 hypothetical protein [Wielerella bovis]MCG7659152.1 hypothetical protein [Wielerella bovis]ULJ61305.1 hypothetical protein MIS44_05530 [Wielerella bovis]ULJ63420.1 hypothetical protein MIS46_05070 [Wielerella bovis]ULJ65587.1 hypothetical protein MIS33_04835 [Wielerella bovis]
MSRTTYIIVAVLSIMFGTFTNYSMVSESKSSRGYTGSSGYVGGFSGGHK